MPLPRAGPPRPLASPDHRDVHATNVGSFADGILSRLPGAPRRLLEPGEHPGVGDLPSGGDVSSTLQVAS